MVGSASYIRGSGPFATMHKGPDAYSFSSTAAENTKADHQTLAGRLRPRQAIIIRLRTTTNAIKKMIAGMAKIQGSSAYTVTVLGISSVFTSHVTPSGRAATRASTPRHT